MQQVDGTEEREITQLQLAENTLNRRSKAKDKEYVDCSMMSTSKSNNKRRRISDCKNQSGIIGVVPGMGIMGNGKCNWGRGVVHSV